ncbi:hypothetical protein [Clostridium sp.]|uniref:hypothetical protein n=1 Tax=Clostridium sp. TaxID=1506 RepID=UPI001A363F04|nr:hypothetical protein [Clostridium sp.]MBK5243000.1 hypothetical protein [Clostridium sp.]
MKKIIITIFITLIFIIIAGFYAGGIIYSVAKEGTPSFLLPLGMIILTIIFIAIIGILIYNMYERIKEIRRGDENDISKY